MIKQVTLDNSYEYLKGLIYTSPNHRYNSFALIVLLNVYEPLEKYQEFGRPRNTSVSPSGSTVTHYIIVWHKSSDMFLSDVLQLNTLVHS